MYFFGKPRSDAAGQGNEAPLVMTGPLILLAILAALGGLGFSRESFSRSHSEKEDDFLVPALAFGALIAGSGLAIPFTATEPANRAI